MKMLLAMAVGAAAFLAAGPSVAQNGNMMGGGGMGGFGWMGGYGGMGVSILVVIIVVGLVAWFVKQKGK